MTVTGDVCMAARSHPLYFEDGNVIILVGKSRFRLHLGQLARHSTVFEDLFSLPQASTSLEMQEGCPVIRLHDCEMDAARFFKALYDGLYLGSPAKADFPVVASIMRISSKYMVDHLRARCLERLKLDWPISLAGWDLREAGAQDPRNQQGMLNLRPSPIFLINLAREIATADVYDMLPSVFYDLCRHNPSAIVRGADGSMECTLERNLSSGDLRAVLRGRDHAHQFIHNFVHSAFDTRHAHAECLRPARCWKSFTFVKINLLRGIAGIIRGRPSDPLHTLQQASDMLDRRDFYDATDISAGNRVLVEGAGKSLDICLTCNMRFKDEIKSARRSVWDCIPAWFGLQAEA